MTRAFTDEAVDPDVVDELLDAGRCAPSAGNTQAVDFLVLEGSDQVAQYWGVTLPGERRSSFPWPGLLAAPVLVVVLVDPMAYPERYAEADKVHTGLGGGVGAWSTPYWWVDGGMAAMSILLAVEDAGLGALFFGVFEHEDAVKSQFGVPPSHRAIGTIALGVPAPEQRRSRSATRRRRSIAEVVHRGRWRTVGGQ